MWHIPEIILHLYIWSQSVKRCWSLTDKIHILDLAHTSLLHHHAKVHQNFIESLTEIYHLTFLYPCAISIRIFVGIWSVDKPIHDIHKMKSSSTICDTVVFDIMGKQISHVHETENPPNCQCNLTLQSIHTINIKEKVFCKCLFSKVQQKSKLEICITCCFKILWAAQICIGRAM